MLARTIPMAIFKNLSALLFWKTRHKILKQGVKVMNEIKVVELFGGIGAIRKAMINLSIDYQIIDYVEKDGNAVKSYNALYSENYIPKDVTDYSLPEKKIDILMHGSPCQDISIAGKMDGAFKNSRTRSSLLWETVRIVDEANEKPQIIIWENVANILSKNFEFVFYDYLDELSCLGYNSSWKVLSPIEFGIPQNRPRMFCVSVKSEDRFDFSKLKKSKMKNLNDFLEKDPPEKFRVSQNQIDRLLGCNRLRIIKDYVYTITTKQDCNYIGFISLGGNQYRTLSTLETCRLMGFSDKDYSILSTTHNVKEDQVSTILHKQFGNSVVVNVLESIIVECLNHLNRRF